MTGVVVSAERLLGLAVRLHGIQLGIPTDLILDPERRKALGFAVLCRDDERRFLPLATATVGADSIQVPSPLVLLEEAQLAFYTQRGSTFRAVRGLDVTRGRTSLGTVADLELGAGGAIEALVVVTAGGRERVPYAGDVEIGAARTVKAAS